MGGWGSGRERGSVVGDVRRVVAGVGGAVGHACSR